MTTETAVTTATTDAAPAAAATTTTETPAAAATDTTNTGAQAAAEGADNAATKDSGESDPAQGTPAPDADKGDDAGQSSDDQDPNDTDKDAEGADKKEGNQEAQPAYSDFTMPEGMELDSEAMNEATPILQELNATQEQAQKMVDVAASMLSKAAKKMADQHNAVVEGWKAETMKAFGNEGDAKFAELQGRAEEVVKHFFNPEQRTLLTHYGFGNHPAFFAMCVAMAQQTGEDRPFVSAAGGEQGEKTLAQTWYPKET